MGCWRTCPGTGIFGNVGNGCRNCKDRCKSWFPGDANMECSCKSRCSSGDTEFSRDDLLNSIGLGPQQAQEIEEQNEEILEQMQADADELMSKLGGIASIFGGVLLVILMIWGATKILKA